MTKCDDAPRVDLEKGALFARNFRRKFLPSHTLIVPRVVAVEDTPKTACRSISAIGQRGDFLYQTDFIVQLGEDTLARHPRLKYPETRRTPPRLHRQKHHLRPRTDCCQSLDKYPKSLCISLQAVLPI